MYLGPHWCEMGPAVRCLGAGWVPCGKVSGNTPSAIMVQDKGAGWAGSGESIAMVDLSANRLCGGLLATPEYVRLRAALVVPKGEWSVALGEPPVAGFCALASGAGGS